MRPRILKIDPNDIDLTLIREAALALRGGELVAFPTETVYGLGANALDPKAVSRIFEAKKRPLDDPLIVHIAREKDIFELTKDIPLEAKKLAKKFWPGPLTIVLKKKDNIPDIVTTGLDTVAIRMPSNPIAVKLIELAGVPVAAPSANLFGRPSPTTAQHVSDDLDGAVDILIDGGRTEIGVESTVIEIVNGEAFILRPGGISVEELSSVIGVKICTEEEILQRSPGKYSRHYSPDAKVVVVQNDEKQVENVLSSSRACTRDWKRAGIMAKKEHARFYKDLSVKVMGPGNDLNSCAAELFHILREFDKEKVDVIIAEAVDEKGIGLAIMNRLRKASSGS